MAKTDPKLTEAPDAAEPAVAAVAEAVDVAEPEAQSIPHDYHYVVKNPFEQYGHGEWITDAADIQRLLAGSNLHHCLRVMPR
jgi:hypothetical protein